MYFMLDFDSHREIDWHYTYKNDAMSNEMWSCECIFNDTKVIISWTPTRQLAETKVKMREELVNTQRVNVEGGWNIGEERLYRLLRGRVAAMRELDGGGGGIAVQLKGEPG